MRIRRESAPGGEFAPEVLELLLAQAALEESPGIDAGRGVALKIDLVAGLVPIAASQEVIESDLQERGRRSVSGNVPADARGSAIGANDHGHGVPTDQTFNSALQFALPRIGRLLRLGDRVEIRRVGLERKLQAAALGMAEKFTDQGCGLGRAAFIEDFVERFDPLTKVCLLGRLPTQ